MEKTEAAKESRPGKPEKPAGSAEKPPPEIPPGTEEEEPAGYFSPPCMLAEFADELEEKAAEPSKNLTGRDHPVLRKPAA
ncbi:MAG: hypothetical protein M0002_02365 [Rhodospirillales bacterium]|nr:hypothetical protein [Rhodospirillales bacterium]